MTFLFFINIVAFIFSFFVTGVLLGVAFSKPLRKKIYELVVPAHIRHKLSLMREPANPVMRPGKNPWRAEAVFNPAALLLGNRTHLIYRAIGIDGISRLGYASSKDGVIFDEQLPYPAYVAQSPRLGPPGHRHYSLAMYPSGGSWGGCEDPRMVLIDGRVYVSFSVFDGWDYIRMGVISIDANDFLNKQFGRWSNVTLLSPPGQRHKNWVLFPEKINGKFAVMHSISPKVEIAYVDSIEDIGTKAPFIQSWVGARDGGNGRPDAWDTYVRGAGPPPLRTEKGWLLFYHAIDAKDPGRYKLGAMLLDLNDPTKVLYRSVVPVLAPDAVYENKGKPGIVYACGATIVGDTLYVYYGGADKVICVAQASLSEFLSTLMSGEHAILMSTTLQTA